MRYYSIVITNPANGQVVLPAGASGGETYTSFANGKSIPGARNVEISAPVFDFASPAGAAFVRIWGISLAEISQSQNLNNMLISVYAGMKKGLPLANPQQSGLILQGVISQAWGNWVGLDMTLDLVVQSGTGTIAAPKNIILDWKKGTKLKDAIANALATAFQGYKQKIDISPNLVLTEDSHGFYQTMTQFAQYVQQVSQSIVGGDYQGVKILLTEKTFTVYDGTKQTDPQEIAFQDMIGQPTWIDPLKVQFKCVMRADLKVGDYIKFPRAAVTSTQSGTPAFGLGVSQKSAFQGTFLITFMQHFGNFRQPDAASWNTTYDCAAIPSN